MRFARILGAPLSVVFIAACATSSGSSAAGRSGLSESSLMQADRDFAIATHTRGIEGWMSFFASDAIRIRHLDGITRGYEAIRKLDEPFIADSTSTLNWEPLEAYVYRSGNIGATTGRYWVIGRSRANVGKELGRGHYVTTWRFEDGRWLVIMDTGYPDPSTPAR